MKELEEILPKERIRARLIDRVSFASDAGFYYLLPKAVVQPQSEAEIIALFHFSHRHKVPIVFRAGGSSLSGQSITDGILVDLSQYWKNIVVEQQGAMVRVQPGTTGAMVNAYLKKHRKKIGPDPSSISAAMMGGILSNNASGMCCGTADNSYHTTRFIRFILPEGQTFSTEKPEDYIRFENDNAALFHGLKQLREEIASNEILYNKIRQKYLMKNTVGYSLNAFIDYDHPLDIFAHLLIGAEGTLAFIAEAVMQTVPEPAHKSTGLLFFPGIYEACQAIIPLTESGAAMVELMDRASLRSVEDMQGIMPMIRTLGENVAALLVEFQEETEAALTARINNFFEKSNGLSLLTIPSFTQDNQEREFYWKVRKGLFPAVGAVRARGTTVILEDVAFPVHHLGAAILDIQVLFKKHLYENGIIFGHAKDGNIHFVITQSFNTPSEVNRYDTFLREVVDLVVNKYHGSLKAEHGTGRNMAPFVETEWGPEAYQIIKKIKTLADPHGLLNPGVIINEDKSAHIANLKAMPEVEEEVDKCIECGYCEHRCPSRDITTSPRRRIVVRRALQTMKSENSSDYRVLAKQYQYDGIDTCAVDGLCAGACPVDINTGDLIKRLRRESHSAFANNAALFVAKHFGAAEKIIRLLLKGGTLANKITGKKTMTRFTGLFKKIIPAFPLWTEEMSAPPKLSILNKKRNPGIHKHTIVYFPACISRMMGSYEGREKNIMECFISVCDKSGIQVIVPKNIEGSCCSQLFSSKGFKEAYSFKANKIISDLWTETLEGKWPVVMDVSSCTYTLKNLRGMLEDKNKAKYDKMRFLDSVDFLHDTVMPSAGIKNRSGRIVLHPVCSLEKMKTTAKLEVVARHYATEVVVPKNAGCCGMAGDRGFLFPELTASATRSEAIEVDKQDYQGYYSSTKTCEMAMSAATGAAYESILYLVDECI